MTFTLYGVTDFEVQYWTGSTWTDVPGGNVTGNNHAWRQFTFASITTAKIRVLINNSLATYSRVTEIEAYKAGANPRQPQHLLQHNTLDACSSERTKRKQSCIQ